MPQNTTLQKIESAGRWKAIREGMAEICIGLLFLIMGLRALLDRPYRH